ncbi:MAG: DUF1559 domain-containing protein [Gemmataceae bacterium]|nr:DUF1559 domain-containing protein [Gemmataceae bacterium]
MTRRAFSLIELVVVLAVIGILVGLLMPAVQSARAASQRAACQNALRQVGLAVHNFEAAHGRVPPAGKPGPGKPDRVLSWMALVLPYLDQEPLYRQALADCAAHPEPFSASTPAHAGFATPVKALTCPADGRLGVPHVFGEYPPAAYGSYLGVSLVNDGVRPSRLADGVFSDVPGIPLRAIRDGASNTVMVIERPPPDSFRAGWWYPDQTYNGPVGPNVTIVIAGEPTVVIRDDTCSVRTPFGPGRTDNPCDRFRVWSLHPGGANFLYADGGVRFHGYPFAALLIPASTIASGEAFTPPD